MNVELTKDEVWDLIEVLDAHAEAVEHLNDDEYIEKLNALEAKLRAVLKGEGK